MKHSIFFDTFDMAVSLAIPINPELLVWARETAGYSVEAAATKFGIKPEKLVAVEFGDPSPSFALVTHELRAGSEHMEIITPLVILSLL